jgi:ComF family protein
MLVEAVFPARCAGCGRSGGAVCRACARLLAPAVGAPPPPFVDDWFALFAYEGIARELVARIKYRNERAIVPWFARHIANIASRRWRVDVVTWAPTTRERRRTRGFDHAQQLARAVARDMNVVHRSLLTRTTTEPQTGRPYRARAHGVAFTSRATGGTVLLVDDVTTTGATLRTAAVALRGAGAGHVVVATIARTPPPRGSSAPRAYTPPR